MIRRFVSVCAAFALFAIASASQERIAILDAVVPAGIDAKVALPVSEKLMEQFVSSRLFIVLDRSFIQKTLSEKAFSVSDLVASEDKVTELGGFLKANYIVVSAMEKIEDSFFLSAKMIQVSTGIIIAQASENKEGGTKVVIDLAKTVGRALIFSAMGQTGALDQPEEAPLEEGMPEYAPFELTRINGGTFQMGSPTQDSAARTDEKPQRSVTVGDFMMGVREVTWAEWYEVMGVDPDEDAEEIEEYAAFPASEISWYEAIVYCNRLSALKGLRPCYSVGGKTDPDAWGDLPEEDNSAWNAVKCDFQATGFRLPIEAEWEYAARGGAASKNTPYPGSEDPDAVAIHGYGEEDGPDYAGMAEPNEAGLFDMGGNVAEWCWDWYAPYPKNAEKSPAGPAKGKTRVLRGGSFSSGATDVRCAARGNGDPWEFSPENGFRVVRKP